MKDIYPTQVLDDAPIVKAAVAIPASQGGTQHKYLRRYTAATVGFRKIGTGVTNVAEVFQDVTVNCEFLDGSFDRDVALAIAHKKGLSAYIEKETLAALKTMFSTLEKALFQNLSIGGFNGLLQFNDYAVQTGTQVVNAGGSGGKSVWLLRWAEDGVAIVAGNEGRIDFSWNDDNPTIIQKTGSGGVYSAYLVSMGGWFTLQVGSTYDAARICNLDGTSGKTLTDDMIADAISRFPAARQPNMIVMNRTALKELRESRTATNPTGKPADFPAEAFNIPIIATDSLPTNEATVVSTTTATSSMYLAEVFDLITGASELGF